MDNETINNLMHSLTSSEGIASFEVIADAYQKVSRDYGKLLQEHGYIEGAGSFLINPTVLFRNMTEEEFDQLPTPTVIKALSAALFIHDEIIATDQDLTHRGRISAAFEALSNLTYNPGPYEQEYLIEGKFRKEILSDKAENIGKAIVMMGECFAEGMICADTHDWKIQRETAKYYEGNTLKSLERYSSTIRWLKDANRILA